MTFRYLLSDDSPLIYVAIFLLVLLTAAVFPASADSSAGDWPALNEYGYIDAGEFVYEGSEEGLWRYCSPSLKVEIIRRSETVPVRVVWYEAEIWSTEGGFKLITACQGEHFRTTDWPQAVCGKRGAVLAVNGDYSCGRWSNMRYPKQRYKVGIQIRNGEIRNDKAPKSGSTSFPNLDTLALYEDGDMEVNRSSDLTAQEYLDKGARDVLSFGPWLIRDGKLNELLPKFTASRSPRTAVGMIEKGHYFAMMAEGRRKDSKGGDLAFLADKLLGKGCRTAFNLDGGETSCMLFMGKQINIVGNSHNKHGYARKGAEFLSVGISALVEGYDPDAP